MASDDVSRRSPKNYDGSDARPSRPSLKITCSGTEEQPHDETLCAHLAWKPDDINPRHPRWTPAGPGPGYHHDGEQWSLLPAVQQVEGVDRYVYVTPSQCVPAALAEPEPALLELTVDGAASRR